MLYKKKGERACRDYRRPRSPHTRFFILFFFFSFFFTTSLKALAAIVVVLILFTLVRGGSVFLLYFERLQSAQLAAHSASVFVLLYQ
jgi:hypothetical protein